MKKVTIRDIAERLGLSKSTVALCLAGKYGPSNETVAQVMFTAHELGYDFSNIRKKSNAKKKIVVLAFKGALNTAFWSNVFLGIEKQAVEENVKLNFIVYDFDVEQEIHKKLKQNNFDGIIAIDYNENDTKLRLSEYGAPVVLIDPRVFSDFKSNQIVTSNFFSGMHCANYLAERGHKRVAFFGDKNYGIGFKNRYLGFKTGCEELGLDFVPISGKGNKRGEFVCNTENFTDILPREAPTAVFCANDLIARYAYACLRELQLKVPEDVAVIGFDNRENSNYTDPPLTSYNIDRLAMGKKAVKMIVERLVRDDGHTEIVELMATLVERKSVNNRF